MEQYARIKFCGFLRNVTIDPMWEIAFSIWQEDKRKLMMYHRFSCKTHDSYGGITNLLNIVSDTKDFPEALAVADGKWHYNETN